jgi:hypothetical protein
MHNAEKAKTDGQTVCPHGVALGGWQLEGGALLLHRAEVATGSHHMDSRLRCSLAEAHEIQLIKRSS